MSRVTIVVLTVMLVSSLAQAQAPPPPNPLPPPFVGVIQTQALVGAITNSLEIAHGTRGSSVTSLDIDNQQRVRAFHDTSARQSQHGFLLQVGSATADSGIIAVGQALFADGAQAQVIGAGHQSLGQVQSANLVGAQVVSKVMWTGGASGRAFQVGGLGSSQFANNSAARANQASQIKSVQTSSFTGEPGDGGTVGSTVTGSTLQSQTVSVI